MSCLFVVCVRFSSFLFSGLGLFVSCVSVVGLCWRVLTSMSAMFCCFVYVMVGGLGQIRVSIGSVMVLVHSVCMFLAIVWVEVWCGVSSGSLFDCCVVSFLSCRSWFLGMFQILLMFSLSSLFGYPLARKILLYVFSSSLRLLSSDMLRLYRRACE